MFNYKKLEVEFFRAKSTGEASIMEEIKKRVQRDLKALDVRCDFYNEEYGDRLDVWDQEQPKTPLQNKYESLLLEYNEVNRLSRVIAAYV